MTIERSFSLRLLGSEEELHEMRRARLLCGEEGGKLRLVVLFLLHPVHGCLEHGHTDALRRI